MPPVTAIFANRKAQRRNDDTLLPDTKRFKAWDLMVVLPSEVIVNILCKLNDQRDIFSCKRVSNNWKRFIDDHHKQILFSSHPLSENLSAFSSVENYNS